MPHGERLSLVQYNNPEPAPADEGANESPNPVEELRRIASCSLPPIEPEKQLRAIMDCILPPRKREIDGRSWLERASTVPSTRFDILGLQQKFENELKVARAKPFGICPIRRRIYDEMFDELIRQVTINCAERGLLLLRVRDEIHLSILSYQSLLESSIGYGIRKAILVEQQQSQAILDRDLERAKNAELSKRVDELEKQLKQERIVKEEEVKLLEEKMKDENERLAESNRTLKMHLQAILQMDQQLQVAQSTLNDTTDESTSSALPTDPTAEFPTTPPPPPATTKDPRCDEPWNNTWYSDCTYEHNQKVATDKVPGEDHYGFQLDLLADEATVETPFPAGHNITVDVYGCLAHLWTTEESGVFLYEGQRISDVHFEFVQLTGHLYHNGNTSLKQCALRDTIGKVTHVNLYFDDKFSGLKIFAHPIGKNSCHCDQPDPTPKDAEMANAATPHAEPGLSSFWIVVIIVAGVLLLLAVVASVAAFYCTRYYRAETPKRRCERGGSQSERPELEASSN
ncbi:Dyla-1 [Aphelenchoides fujianensis]|nr:Dyla-1 [Aphelenchoides fujianensis]